MLKNRFDVRAIFVLLCGITCIIGDFPSHFNLFLNFSKKISLITIILQKRLYKYFFVCYSSTKEKFFCIIFLQYYIYKGASASVGGSLFLSDLCKFSVTLIFFLRILWNYYIMVKKAGCKAIYRRWMQEVTTKWLL